VIFSICYTISLYSAETKLRRCTKKKTPILNGAGLKKMESRGRRQQHLHGKGQGNRDKRRGKQESKQTYVANEGGVDEGSEWVCEERERARHGDSHDLLPEGVPPEREPARRTKGRRKVKNRARERTGPLAG
jgi:hypothetical protein